MKWHTEFRKVSELKNWEDNPRTISGEAYEELKEKEEADRIKRNSTLSLF